MGKKEKITKTKLKEKYIKDRTWALSVIKTIEKRYGYMGVLAVFQHWFRDPVRGSFDWYVKDKDGQIKS